MIKNKKILLIIATIVFILTALFGIFLLIFTNSQKEVSKDVPTMGYGQIGDPKELSEYEKIVGSVSIVDCGANGNDNLDDTDAFEKAISKNMPVYIPSGTYYVNRPLAINNQNFYGDGENSSIIIGKIADKKLPIIYVGGSSNISKLTFSYDKKLITGKENQAERVAVSCGALIAFGPAGGIQDVCFNNVGTAVYSDNTDNFGSNNCCFENIIIDSVTYRGFDFIVNSGCGNVFKQIEINNSNAQSAFNFDGAGGCDILENIKINKCVMDYAFGYSTLSGLSFDEPLVKDSKFSKNLCVCLDE